MNVENTQFISKMIVLFFHLMWWE